MSVLLAVWIPPLHAAGGLGSLPLILTLHPPGCSAAALKPLPCYHHHYSSRVAAPSVERGKQRLLSISTELLSGRNTNQHTKRWEMYRKSARQPLTQLGLTACRCSWGVSVDEITSASGTTAGLLPETTVYRMEGRIHASNGTPCSTSHHRITSMMSVLPARLGNTSHGSKWLSMHTYTGMLFIINKLKA